MHRVFAKARGALLFGFLAAGLASTNTVQAASAVPGVSATEVRVGWLGPESGPAATYGDVRKGILAYFDYINSQGGVNGRKLKLFSYDDKYQPALTVRMMHRLVEKDHIFATLGDIGSPTNAAVQKYVQDQGLPMIMLCSAANRFFVPPIANFMGSCIASYSFEAKVMVNYAVKNLHRKALAFAYDNTDYGKPILEAAMEAVKSYPGVKVVAQTALQPAETDFSAQAQQIKDAKPDAVLVFGTPAPTAHLKKALSTIGITSANSAYLTTQEGGANTVLWQLAGKDVWKDTYSLTSVPSVDAKTKPIELFLGQLKKQFPDTDPSGSPQSGWASAQVFVEALRRTQDLTRENFLKTFYTFDNWKGSLFSSITFTPDDHFGISSLIVTQAKDGTMAPISGLISINNKTGQFTESAAAQ